MATWYGQNLEPYYLSGSMQGGSEDYAPEWVSEQPPAENPAINQLAMMGYTVTPAFREVDQGPDTPSKRYYDFNAPPTLQPPPGATAEQINAAAQTLPAGTIIEDRSGVDQAGNGVKIYTSGGNGAVDVQTTGGVGLAGGHGWMTDVLNTVTTQIAPAVLAAGMTMGVGTLLQTAAGAAAAASATAAGATAAEAAAAGAAAGAAAAPGIGAAAAAGAVGSGTSAAVQPGADLSSVATAAAIGGASAGLGAYTAPIISDTTIGAMFPTASQAVTTGGISAGITGAMGGSLKDSLLAGLQSGAISYVTGSIPSFVDTETGDTSLPEDWGLTPEQMVEIRKTYEPPPIVPPVTPTSYKWDNETGTWVTTPPAEPFSNFPEITELPNFGNAVTQSESTIVTTDTTPPTVEFLRDQINRGRIEYDYSTGKYRYAESWSEVPNSQGIPLDSVPPPTVVEPPPTVVEPPPAVTPPVTQTRIPIQDENGTTWYALDGTLWDSETGGNQITLSAVTPPVEPPRVEPPPAKPPPEPRYKIIEEDGTVKWIDKDGKIYTSETGTEFWTSTTPAARIENPDGSFSDPTDLTTKYKAATGDELWTGGGGGETTRTLNDDGSYSDPANPGTKYKNLTGDELWTGGGGGETTRTLNDDGSYSDPANPGTKYKNLTGDELWTKTYPARTMIEPGKWQDVDGEFYTDATGSTLWTSGGGGTGRIKISDGKWQGADGKFYTSESGTQLWTETGGTTDVRYKFTEDDGTVKWIGKDGKIYASESGTELWTAPTAKNWWDDLDKSTKDWLVKTGVLAVTAAGIYSLAPPAVVPTVPAADPNAGKIVLGPDGNPVLGADGLPTFGGTLAEQIMGLQNWLLRKSASQQTSLEPYNLKQAGLKKDANGNIVEMTAAEKWMALDPATRASEQSYLLMQGKYVDPATGEITQATEDQMLAGMSDTQKSQYAIQKAQNERQQQALAGTLPIPEYIKQGLDRQAGIQEEGYARRLGSGYNLSTIGAAQEANDAKNRAATESQIAQGQIDSSAALANISNNIAQSGISNALQSTGIFGGQNKERTQQANAIPGSTASLIGTGNQVLQPIQNAQESAWNVAMTSAGLQNQANAAQYGLYGTVAGAVLSSRELKKDIKKMNPSDDDDVLDMMMGNNIYEYNYKDEPSDGDTRHISMMAEEAPEEVTAAGGKMIDMYKLTGLQGMAIKALAKKVKQLESGRA